MQGSAYQRFDPLARVVTDAVFSVSGDLAPAAALRAVARRHRALLTIDEAHSFGVRHIDGKRHPRGVARTGIREGLLPEHRTSGKEH